MKVIVQIKSDTAWVKRAMLTTMGIHPLLDPIAFRVAMGNPISEKTYESLLIGRHSPIEEYEIWVDAIVSERVHTHVVRHKELGKYITTSRPDRLKYTKPLPEGERVLSLRFNAKRLIEICWQRLCFQAWGETIGLFVAIKAQMSTIDPVLAGLLAPSCCWFGFCPETAPDNTCQFIETERGFALRDYIVARGRQL